MTDITTVALVLAWADGQDIVARDWADWYWDGCVASAQDALRDIGATDLGEPVAIIPASAAQAAAEYIGSDAGTLTAEDADRIVAALTRGCA